MISTESFSLRDILRVFYLNKIFFIIFPLIFVLPAYFGYELVTPTYTATVKMYVKGEGTTEAEYYRAINAQDIISDHSQLVTSNLVVNRVVEALKLYEIPDDYEKKYASPIKRFFMGEDSKNENNKSDNRIGYDGAKGLLLSNISVVGAGQSNMFFIHFEDFNPAQAVKIVNSLSRSYVVFVLQQQIQELKIKYGEKNSLVIQLENYIKDYEQYLDGRLMPDLEALGPASVKIAAQAEGANRTARVSLPILMGFAFFAGIFLAAVFSALVVYFDNRFRSPNELVKYLNMPFIGSIPKRKKDNELIMSDENLARSSLKCVNSFQRFGDKVSLLSKKNNIKTILITAFKGEGDTTALIANLGIYLSRDAGKKVLIIDANLSDPKLANIMHLPENSGLPDVFEGKKTFEEALVNKGKNLDLLLTHAVSYRPMLLLGSSFMTDLIKEVRNKYDFVLVDCSVDLIRDSESVALSALTDATILIVNEGMDRIQDAKVVMNNLMQNGDRLIFSVLNNRSDEMPSFFYKLS